MIEQTLKNWHKMLETGDNSLLADILAEDVVFHSPVVHTPQVGKPITTLYLSAASDVLGGDNFHYLREVVDGNHAILEFQTEIDGIKVNGVDMISFDDAGKINDFKVMVRPLKAINLVHQKMGEMLQQLAPKAS